MHTLPPVQDGLQRVASGHPQHKTFLYTTFVGLLHIEGKEAVRPISQEILSN